MDFRGLTKKLLGYPDQEPVVVHTDPMITEPEEVSGEEISLEMLLDASGSGGSSYGRSYASVFFNKIDSKESWFKEVDKVTSSDYVESILTTVSDDVLHLGHERQDEFFMFSFNDEKLEKDYGDDTRQFLASLQIYEYLLDMLTYILLYGERLIKIDYRNAEIDEIYGQSKLLTLYERSKYKLMYDQSVNKAYNPLIFVPLRFRTYTYSTGMKTKSGSQLYAKIGKPIFPSGSLERISALKILESLIPLYEIINIDRKMYFYFRVPTGTSVKDAFAQSRDFERMLSGLLQSEIPKDVESFIEKSAKVKVIPLFGEQKDLDYKEIPKPDRIDSTMINDLRRSLAAAVGDIPAAVLAVPDGETKPSSRYLQMVKKIRVGLAECVKNIAWSYIKEVKDVTIDISHIVVKIPIVPGASELEVADFVSTFSDSVSNLVRLIDDSSNLLSSLEENKAIDYDKVVDFLNAKMKQVSDHDFFLKLEDQPEKSDDDDSDY